jgi:peroxiredoxin
MAELRGLGGIHDELRDLGVRIAAISVDPPAKSKEVARRTSAPFPLLADAQGVVTRAYGLLHEGGGLRGEDIALPAHVLIDPDGKVLWRFVSHRIQQRLGPTEVLRVVKARVLASPLSS